MHNGAQKLVLDLNEWHADKTEVVVNRSHPLVDKVLLGCEELEQGIE